MLTRKDVALRVIEAALSVKLPVFVGFVCKVNMTFDELDEPAKIGSGTEIEEMVHAVLALPGAAEGIAGFHIHNTKIWATAHACMAVRSAGWTGVLGAYPDHGDFEMPHWQFHDLPPEELMKAASQWVAEAGVSMLGGCCGIGPQHIVALKQVCDASR